MCRPQYKHMPACRLNRRLHSRRHINSRSVCRRVIPVNRDWGHCRRRSLISAVETAGPVTLVISRNVTSWKPRGFALVSGTSTACRLNRRLHSRRHINSRSVCCRVIPVNRDWGHCRRRSLISAVETAGPVTLVISRNVTSWKPRGFALVSGMSTQTLFWTLPGGPDSVWRHRKAPSDPGRLGRQRCPTRPLPVTPSSHMTQAHSTMSAARSEN